MDFETIEFKELEPGINQITLNRPERLNAINLKMLDDFHVLYNHLLENKDIRVLIITGAGRGFCSGADLKDAALMDEAPNYFATPAAFLEKIQKVYSNMIMELKRLPQPIIGAVNGAAAGGGMCIALASDILFASPEASFIASFINIGLSGGELGTSYLLPRLIGSARANEILLTGRKVDAAEAEKIGLVNKVVPREELIETALQTARMMIGKSPIGLRLTKETLTNNLDASSLEAAIELENRNQTICAFSGDFSKAVGDFSGNQE